MNKGMIPKNKGMIPKKKDKYDKSVKHRKETYRGIRKYSRVKKL